MFPDLGNQIIKKVLITLLLGNMSPLPGFCLLPGDAKPMTAVKSGHLSTESFHFGSVGQIPDGGSPLPREKLWLV